jgi:hypothetical protein
MRTNSFELAKTGQHLAFGCSWKMSWRQVKRPALETQIAAVVPVWRSGSGAASPEVRPICSRFSDRAGAIRNELGEECR